MAFLIRAAEAAVGYEAAAAASRWSQPTVDALRPDWSDPFSVLRRPQTEADLSPGPIMEIPDPNYPPQALTPVRSLA